MAIYVLNTDPNAIDFEHAALQVRVEALLGRTIVVYRPLAFVEHSGFSETVREEIALVLANHPAGEAPLRAFDDFVETWDLGMHLDRRVLDLSGGWRKYLGLALALNRPLPARLLLDTTSHLSDARMRTLLARAGDAGDTVFGEYDPHLLYRLESTDLPMHRLVDNGTAITEMGR